MNAIEMHHDTAPPGLGLSVLLVDDDEYVRTTTARMLSIIGIHDVRQADSAAAALEMAAHEAHPLHIVISDLDMPDIDGMEFLRRLSEQRLDAGILIISAQDDSILRSVETMARAYGLSVLGVLPKPVTVGMLRDMLVSYPRRSALRDKVGTGSVSVNEVRGGLDRNEFTLVYQPKVELQSGHIRGVEALVRWRHPTRGVLTPDQFVPVTERYGLMDELTLIVLHEAAGQVQRWAQAGLPGSVSVNVSLSSLSDTSFSARVIGVLSRFGVAPSQLTVEITETVAMGDVARCLETLARLRMHGVGLSIDDFGTGHSSLQQLSRVPFTELKIDRAFVTGASTQPRLRAIIESSVDIAKRLGLTCVGEGVETLEDRDLLVEVGCGIGQGFFLGRPMDAARLAEWFRLVTV